MEVLKQPSIERRNESHETTELWDNLSLAQKFSVSSLGKFGYELICIRNMAGANFAILECNGGAATISEDGEINVDVEIQLRAELCV